MRFRSQIEIASPPEEVFEVYLDVEHWPDWTPSVTSVQRLEPGPLRLGARSRVRQPRLPVTEWVVTELVPGRSFSWEATAPGIHSVGRHVVEPRPGGCLAIGEIEQRGLLAPVAVALTARLTRRYLREEADGLKAYCERRDG